MAKRIDQIESPANTVANALDMRRAVDALSGLELALRAVAQGALVRIDDAPLGLAFASGAVKPRDGANACLDAVRALPASARKGFNVQWAKALVTVAVDAAQCAVEGYRTSLALSADKWRADDAKSGRGANAIHELADSGSRTAVGAQAFIALNAARREAVAVVKVRPLDAPNDWIAREEYRARVETVNRPKHIRGGL